MNNTSIPVIIIASISFYVGMYHLWMFIRRTAEKENLSFSLLCVTVGLYNVFCAGLYNSTSIPEGMYWQRFQLATIALFAITMAWFVYHVTGGHRMKRWGIIALTGFFMIFFLLGFLIQGELTLSLAKALPKHIELWGVIDVTYHEVDPGPIYAVQLVFTIIAYSYLLYMLISYYRKTRQSYFLSIIFSQVLFFIITTSDIMVATAVYPFIYLTEYAFMAIIMAMAYVLLNKFVNLHFEVEDLNRGLELKVAERTRELSDAKDALWGEMQLAKKIQTVLLPLSPKISGYEISAFMVPADEVGGDYYDIINVGNMDWVVIGDVSGHGVSAGLVMMMAQTAIQTVLYDNPDMDPSRLLGIINHSISRNIRQLGEDKYMTITVLAVHRGGGFMFSGLHQDIMIYRAATGALDIVETDGMWIGIVDDIREMVTDRSIQLAAGDTLLLFTDGITEAMDKVNGGEMYGDKRLAELFRSLGAQPVEAIKKGILDSLTGYIRIDDSTLVVMKRL